MIEPRLVFQADRGLAGMIITTDKAEVGIVLRSDGIYELALYRRCENRLIRFAIDPVLAWAVGAALNAPITAAPVEPA